jgi:hypothetical protein
MKEIQSSITSKVNVERRNEKNINFKKDKNITRVNTSNSRLDHETMINLHKRN